VARRRASDMCPAAAPLRGVRAPRRPVAVVPRPPPPLPAPRPPAASPLLRGPHPCRRGEGEPEHGYRRVTTRPQRSSGTVVVASPQSHFQTEDVRYTTHSAGLLRETPPLPLGRCLGAGVRRGGGHRGGSRPAAAPRGPRTHDGLRTDRLPRGRAQGIPRPTSGKRTPSTHS